MRCIYRVNVIANVDVLDDLDQHLGAQLGSWTRPDISSHQAHSCSSGKNLCLQQSIYISRMDLRLLWCLNTHKSTRVSCLSWLPSGAHHKYSHCQPLHDFISGKTSRQSLQAAISVRMRGGCDRYVSNWTLLRSLTLQEIRACCFKWSWESRSGESPREYTDGSIGDTFFSFYTHFALTKYKHQYGANSGIELWVRD